MAMERELGMSQLIEAMMPNPKNWQPQAARLISSHLAFDIIYFPGWVIMGLILANQLYPNSSPAIMVSPRPFSFVRLGGCSIHVNGTK
jgi:ATP-binding cassette, subfamily A (ABC1), member 3